MRMSTVAPATPAAPVFEYGEAGALTLTAADAASTFNADGTIRIVVPRSGVGNPAIGQNLTGFLSRIAVFGGVVTLTPDNMPDSLAPSGSYTVVGNSFCRPNTAPIALLTASPTSGPQPLTVNFNGSGSSDEDTEPPADSIVSYTFNFGDGSPEVTCPSAPGCAGATINHTYTDSGEYPATLRVTHSRGKVSTNPARVVIHVQGPTPTPSTVQFSAAPNVGEADASVTVSVTRSGDTSGAASVKYSTSDTFSLNSPCSQANTGIASERCDYETSVGTLRWAAGEGGTKSFIVPIINDAYPEGPANESFSVTLSSPIGVTITSPSSATVTIIDNDTTLSNDNPIDDVDFYINQLYFDILGRLPDQQGFQNWHNTLANCPNGGYGEPPTSNCDRLHVAAGFLQSDEYLESWLLRFPVLHGELQSAADLCSVHSRHGRRGWAKVSGGRGGEQSGVRGCVRATAGISRQVSGIKRPAPGRCPVADRRLTGWFLQRRQSDQWSNPARHFRIVSGFQQVSDGRNGVDSVLWISATRSRTRLAIRTT